MKNALKRGFTLVELLVVVLIIGILSSVALPQYTKAVKKAKGVQVITSASALARAVNMAYLEDGNYRRRYHSYAGSFVNEPSDFDIDIPQLKIKGENWGLLAYGNGGRSCDVYAWKGGGNVGLTYYLYDGKISYVSCSGSECSSYFPGTILSSN